MIPNPESTRRQFIIGSLGLLVPPGGLKDSEQVRIFPEGISAPDDVMLNQILWTYSLGSSLRGIKSGGRNDDETFLTVLTTAPFFIGENRPDDQVLLSGAIFVEMAPQNICIDTFTEISLSTPAGFPWIRSQTRFNTDLLEHFIQTAIPDFFEGVKNGWSRSSVLVSNISPFSLTVDEMDNLDIHGSSVAWLEDRSVIRQNMVQALENGAGLLQDFQDTSPEFILEAASNIPITIPIIRTAFGPVILSNLRQTSFEIVTADAWKEGLWLFEGIPPTQVPDVNDPRA